VSAVAKAWAGAASCACSQARVVLAFHSASRSAPQFTAAWRSRSGASRRDCAPSPGALVQSSVVKTTTRGNAS